MLLEVLLSWGDQLDGSKLVTKLCQCSTLEKGFLLDIPTGLESGDDWANESTLIMISNWILVSLCLSLAYLDTIWLDSNEAIHNSELALTAHEAWGIFETR